MNTMLRFAPNRTIEALRNLIVRYNDMAQKEVLAVYKTKLNSAKDEIEKAQCEIEFHQRMSFLYDDLASVLTCFEGSLDKARKMDEAYRIRMLERYLAECRRKLMAALADERRRRANKKDELSIVDFIIAAFVIGYLIGLAHQIQNDPEAYNIAKIAKIDELLKLAKEATKNKISHW